MKTVNAPYLYTGEGSAIDNYNRPKSQLKNIVQASRNSSKNNWGFFDKKNKQHRTILSQLRTLQWVVKNEKWGEVPDLNRFGEFLKSDKSPVRKPLKDMTPEEVSKIISCLDSITIKNFK
ncbi:hypothetical protein GJU43_13930 [Flavobacterium sp. LC2016-23]|uniref:hypothetical protein n=1 Tax=Flavobacterium sp. LC2016-23 TaxID=2666330 RepID=UPI0012B04F4D|nr:hypothetical protein [Flavobacterium sp. LC2016-23]MRX40382.1 hypothetical protein [Flavobacterium sp. LC2016-23]